MISIFCSIIIDIFHIRVLEFSSAVPVTRGIQYSPSTLYLAVAYDDRRHDLRLKMRSACCSELYLKQLLENNSVCRFDIRGHRSAFLTPKFLDYVTHYVKSCGLGFYFRIILRPAKPTFKWSLIKRITIELTNKK